MLLCHVYNLATTLYSLICGGSHDLCCSGRTCPGAQEHKNTDSATGEFMDGFLIMMLLDTTLG